MKKQTEMSAELVIHWESNSSAKAKKAFLALIRDTYDIQKLNFELNNNVLILSLEENALEKVESLKFPDRNRFLQINHLLMKNGLNFTSEEDLLEFYFENVTSSQLNPNFDVIFNVRRIYIDALYKKSKIKRPALFTIDSEDQHAYFDNLNNRCTSLLKSHFDHQDTRLSNMLQNTLSQLLEYNITPLFMLTCSDLFDNFKDGFGNRISQPEVNREVISHIHLNKSAVFGIHSYDHEEWLKRGATSVDSMTWFSKFKYVFQCTLNPKIYLNYISKLVKNKNKKNASKIIPKLLSKDYVLDDLSKFLQSTNDFISLQKFMRAPGFRVSKGYFCALNELGIDDSSFVVDWRKYRTPIIRYSVIIDEDEKNVSFVTEFPCLFIDDLFRRRKSKIHTDFRDYVSGYSNITDTDFCVCSHTKILGTNSKHTHLLSWDMSRGLALPRNEKSTSFLLDVISTNFIFDKPINPIHEFTKGGSK
jgi:hypothetical protein